MIKRRLINVIRVGIIAFILLATILTIFCFTRNAVASQGSKNRYYTSIMIEEGDSLWDIAARHHVEDASISDYMNEICNANGINKSDTLKAGDYLTIYYYR